MKTKYLITGGTPPDILSILLTISFIIISFLAGASVISVGKVSAQETTGVENIQYPVEELGNCQNQSACKSYCDEPENVEACVDFAEKNDLMSEEEIDMAKKFIAAGSNGPGGCQTKDSCSEYCDDINHINECISFAEENNLLPPKELEEAKKVQAAIAQGVKPPSCGNKKACDVYCDNPDHMEECVTFGEAAGFIQGKELEDAKKMLAAVKRGVKPPPCHGKEACDEYCNNPDNMETCMTFAMEAGFMTEEEKANSQKMLEALKKGIKPPQCRGKEECDVYCGQEEHFEECINFSEAAGFMSSEEAAMARKTKGKGPGDCKGKDECESFCNNPDNQETCFNFAKENGMIPEEDLKRMEEGKQMFKESLEQAPPAVIECLNSQLGTEMMEKFKSGAVMPPREIGDKMRVCFEQMGPPPQPGEPGAGGTMPPGGQTGPGGCQNPDECQAFCETNPEECKNFQPMPGSPGNEQNVPGPGNPSPWGIPAGLEGQPGGESPQPPLLPSCNSPEECQEMQNRIINPSPCQGENCQYGPPPTEQPGGQQPAPGENPFQVSPQPLTPPEQQQPQIEQQQPPLPPANQLEPPSENPPPVIFITPESLFGSIESALMKLLHP